MARFPLQFQATDQLGKIIVGETVTLTLTGTTTVAICYEASTGGSAIPNGKLTTDVDGEVKYWVDEADYVATQFFRITLSGNSFVTKILDDVMLFPATSVDAAAAEAAASAAAALVSENNAAADEALTNADAIATAADAVSTGNDVTSTNADVVSTNADVVLTNADVVLTGLDVISTGDDVTASAASASAAATSETNAAASAATIPTNFSTTADPTVNSDAANTDGNGTFAVGSHWTNTTSDTTFHCVDATATTAIWISVSTGIGTIPVIHVTKGGTDQTGVVTATDTVVTWGTEVIDTEGSFASNAWTPQTAGKYLIICQCTIVDLTDQKKIDMKLFKNTTIETFSRTQCSTAATQDTVALIMAIVEANGTDDDFNIKIQHDNGTNRSIEGDALQTFLMGFKIAED